MGAFGRDDSEQLSRTGRTLKALGEMRAWDWVGWIA